MNRLAALGFQISNKVSRDQIRRQTAGFVLARMMSRVRGHKGARWDYFFSSPAPWDLIKAYTFASTCPANHGPKFRATFQEIVLQIILIFLIFEPLYGRHRLTAIGNDHHIFLGKLENFWECVLGS